MSTLAITILVALVLVGVVLAIAERLPFGRETHTLSIRQLPNIVADLESATADTVAHP